MDQELLHHPLLKNMDAEKIQFIQNFAQKDKPTNMNDAMPFLLANMNLAKKNNIRFTNQEIHLLVDILSKDLSDNDKSKVRRIMNMLIK